jgi:predicted nucleic acid-binding protein
MASLLDASLWIDFTRRLSPRHLKEFIAPYILDPEACVAEPITFEVLRHATDDELSHLQAQFETMLVLATPPTLWSEAADLGRRCRRRGINAGSLDLLIAGIALHHDTELVTFDADFERIAEIANIRVKRLHRPVA